MSPTDLASASDIDVVAVPLLFFDVRDFIVDGAGWAVGADAFIIGCVLFFIAIK